MVRRRKVGAGIRTKGRGVVYVLEDGDGHQWVQCTGCRLDRYTPGISPARATARQHAGSCIA